MYVPCHGEGPEKVPRGGGRRWDMPRPALAGGQLLASAQKRGDCHRSERSASHEAEDELRAAKPQREADEACATELSAGQTHFLQRPERHEDGQSCAHHRKAGPGQKGHDEACPGKRTRPQGVAAHRHLRAGPGHRVNSVLREGAPRKPAATHHAVQEPGAVGASALGAKGVRCHGRVLAPRLGASSRGTEQAPRRPRAPRDSAPLAARGAGSTATFGRAAHPGGQGLPKGG
jgi:hypothetical protein